MNTPYIDRTADMVSHAHQVPIRCVGLLSDDQGRILLVRDGEEPEWGLPGGEVKENETLMLSLIRRLHEQLGLLTYPNCILHIIDDVDATNTVQSISVVFGVARVSSAGQLHEALNVEQGWFSPDRLPRDCSRDVFDALACSAHLPIAACRRSVAGRA